MATRNRHNRVVVVGGGIGGVATAAALRSGGYAGEIVILDRAEFPYDRPPLSKDYLSGKRDLKEIALQQQDWYVAHRIDVIGPVEVTTLAANDECVTVVLADGRECIADQVVLATGGRAARPPIQGSESGRVHVLRDVADADALRAVLVPGARLLVVGGGLIGAEVASTARAWALASCSSIRSTHR